MTSTSDKEFQSLRIRRIGTNSTVGEDDLAADYELLGISLERVG
jgi:hypothetical protein